MEANESCAKRKVYHMSVDISVIVPVYNVEPYLQECLDSILSQSGCSFEVICIDDGSTDSSLQILKAAAQKDSRIQIIAQENQGQSAARNQGLDVAKGQYIFFMDSDDVLAEHVFEPLVTRANQEQLDHIVFCTTPFLDNSGGVIDKKTFDGEVHYHTIKDDSVFNLPLKGDELFCRLMKANSFYVTPQLRMIKRSLIEERGLRFIAGLIHEDNHFTTLALLFASRAIVIPEKYCYRRVRGGSTMTASDASIRHVVGYLGVSVKLQAEFEKLRDQNLIFENAMKHFQEILLAACSEYPLLEDDAEEIILRQLTQTCSKEEICTIRWIMLPFLKQVRFAKARARKYYEKRLSFRLRRLLGLKTRWLFV